MCDPGLLIADEPTTLDVIAQDQVMRVIDSLQETWIALLVISHDIAIIAEAAKMSPSCTQAMSWSRAGATVPGEAHRTPLVCLVRFRI